MLNMEQFEKNWHYDPQGRRVYTMRRLRNPFMDGIHRLGLHPPREDTLLDTAGLEEIWLPSQIH